MADQKPLYSTCVAILGFVCFAIGATAVGLPVWGYFQSPRSNVGGLGAEKGYFGPWRTCKEALYAGERCGSNVSKFRTSVAVWIAGLVAALGVAVLGIFCFLSVLQLAMISSKEKVILKYSAVLITKLALGLLACLLAIAAAGLFALQTDDANNGYEVSRGMGFYIQIALIVLDAILFVMSLYDVIFSRRAGGDPTKSTSIPEATTYGNPGYRDRGPTNGTSISMTDASGKPYSGATNGSMMSMSTTMTSASSLGSNGSTIDPPVTRSPLRSSLKKPKPKDGFGIPNPGFSGSSPTFSRNGSMKKVRIQTHSTEV